MEKLKTIKIAGRVYPIKCSNFVLAQIQEKYGDLSTFEDKLAGRKPVYDNNGNKVRDDENKIVFERAEVSMDAINFFLPLVVNEGLEIEAIEKNKPAETIDPKALVRSIDCSPYKLAIELLVEFYRAFNIKK